MTTPNNFKATVPQAVQDKLLALATEIKSDFHLFKSEGSDPTIEEIEGNHVSGWVSFQDGGYSVTDIIRCDQDNTFHVIDGMSEWADQQAANCFEWFKSDKGLDDNVTYDQLTDEQQTNLADWENEFFEGALLRFDCYVNGNPFNDIDSGAIVMTYKINYRDAPYFRETSDENIFKMTMTQDEFLAADVVALAAEIKKGAENVDAK